MFAILWILYTYSASQFRLSRVFSNCMGLVTTPRQNRLEIWESRGKSKLTEERWRASGENRHCSNVGEWGTPTCCFFLCSVGAVRTPLGTEEHLPQGWHVKLVTRALCARGRGRTMSCWAVVWRKVHSRNWGSLRVRNDFICLSWKLKLS